MILLPRVLPFRFAHEGCEAHPRQKEPGHVSCGRMFGGSVEPEYGSPGAYHEDTAVCASRCMTASTGCFLVPPRETCPSSAQHLDPWCLPLTILASRDTAEHIHRSSRSCAHTRSLVLLRSEITHQQRLPGLSMARLPLVMAFLLGENEFRSAPQEDTASSSAHVCINSAFLL